MISSSSGPTTRLARFLDRLIRPLFKRVNNTETWLSSGADFIQRFELYTMEPGRIGPNTKFVTLKINNLSTMLPHDGVATAMNHFLSAHIPWNRIENLTFETVQCLTELFLQNNLFFYNGKIYRHVKGCPNSLPFSETLTKIYLLFWRTPLTNVLESKQEFFAR